MALSAAKPRLEELYYSAKFEDICVYTAQVQLIHGVIRNHFILSARHVKTRTKFLIQKRVGNKLKVNK